MPRKKEPLPKFASLHSEFLENGRFSVKIPISKVFFIDENTAVLGQTEAFHEPLTFAQEQIIDVDVCGHITVDQETEEGKEHGSFTDLPDLILIDGGAQQLRFARQALLDMGVKHAYALDGGQTAALVMNDQLINRVDWGMQRKISDIIYFATAVPSGG